MKGQYGSAAMIALFALGCDARASEEYRGEPLFSLTGSLAIDSANDWSDLEPVIMFFDPDQDRLRSVLDVDTRGEFPAKFTVDLMQPPPAAALQKVPGMPSFAIGTITALPRNHAATYKSLNEALRFPTGDMRRWSQSGVYYRESTFCWNEGECYVEISECESREDEECSKIVEQTGDPSIKTRIEELGDFSKPLTAYLLIYIANDGPLESTRGYLPHPFTAYISDLFGKGPMTAGYHLAEWSNPLPDDVWPALQQCTDESSNAAAARTGALHEKDWKTYFDLFGFVIVESGGKPYDHPYHREYVRLLGEETFDRECMGSGARGLDASSSEFEITLNHDNLNLR